MTHRAIGGHARRALRAVRAEAERLEGLLSRFRPGSDIDRLNRSAGLVWEALSPEAFEVLSAAARCFRLSRGCFDVTVAPLVDLWDCLHAREVPDEGRIRQILPLVNGADLMLDPSTNYARLRRPGQLVDPGGIGKGYAADRFIKIFKENGCKSAFTNIGGNVGLLGCRPEGAPWSVGIRHPREAGRLLGAVSVQNCAVVTSGDYERCFISPDGKVCHHILDPATGYPADSGLISVTVVADKAIWADALSTAVFVAGIEKGMMLLKSFEGAEAVLVDKDLVVYVTDGLAGRFTAAHGIGFTVLID